MRTSLAVLPVLALLLADVTVSAATLRIDSEVERSDGKRERGRLWIDGKRVRMEFGQHPDGGPRFTWIYRADRKLMWALDPAGERYAEIPESELEDLGRRLAAARSEVAARLAALPPQQRALVERMLGPAARSPTAAPRADRIADAERETSLDGVPVRVHPLLAVERRTGELWVCSWKHAGVSRRKLRVLRNLARFQRDLLDQLDTAASVRQAAPPFELFDQLDGYPLQLTTPVATTRFAPPVEVEVPDDHFERPAGASAASAAAILDPAAAAAPVQPDAGGS